MNEVRNKKSYDFLHTKGYNAFTIPKLTPLEINFLVEGHNLRMPKPKRGLKKRR